MPPDPHLSFLDTTLAALNLFPFFGKIGLAILLTLQSPLGIGADGASGTGLNPVGTLTSIVNLPVSEVLAIDIVWLFGLVALFLFFSFATVALVRSRSSRLEEMVEKGRFGATGAIKLLEQPDPVILLLQSSRFLLSILIGFQLAYISAWFETPALKLLALTAFFVVTLFVVQLVKSVAFAFPERALSALSGPLRLLSWILRPLLNLLVAIFSFLMKGMGLRVFSERELSLTPQDLSEAVELGGEEFEENERELLQGVLSASETTVQEVMTPRKDVASVSINATLEEVVGVFLEAGYSRLLAIGEELDDVRGMLLAKDLMPYLHQKPLSFSVKSIVRKPVFLDGAISLHQALRTLRSEASHFAVVVDEHGGVDGVVTMEDLIEEIVGDILDEHDSPEDEKEVEMTKAGDLLVDGGMSLDDLYELYGLEFPEGEYGTLAGFILQYLGRIPDAGDMVKYNGYNIKIEQVEHNRLTLLRIFKNEEHIDLGEPASSGN